jgi:hypothetical protein
MLDCSERVPGLVQPECQEMQSSSVPLRARARTAGGAPSNTPTSKNRRARKGEWEQAYFDALARGGAAPVRWTVDGLGLEDLRQGTESQH